jgi:sigma-B regulation protein RsbU (phosphoserine phosphatase)
MQAKYKKAEKALRETESNLSRAQAIAHVGSWHMDVSNHLTWSDEVFRIFGIPKGTALTYGDFLAKVHPEDRERVYNAWAAALRGEPYDIEHRVVVDGTLKWVSEKAQAAFNSHGNAIDGIGTVQDITERKHAEEEVRRANTELEQRVIERTLDLRRANMVKDELLIREQEARAELTRAREAELEIGRRIQKTLLLDQPPQDMPGLRVAALSIPSQKIDGDFYVFFKHPDHRLDVIVGDVMGKGVPAALLGAAAKTQLIEAISHLTALSRDGRVPEPKDIMTLTNAEVVQHLISLESFVTLDYVRLDLDHCSATLVDCGHTGLIRMPKSGECELIHGENLPLGVREGEVYSQIRLRFAPEDILIFYSDGVTEARNSTGEYFGVERLMQCIRANCELEPDALVEAIRNAALTFSAKDPPADDLTCVAIKAEPRPVPLARAELKLISDLNELGRARQFVRAFCRDLPGKALNEESISELELAVTEACSNIIKHAYHRLAGQWINLEAEAFSESVSIQMHYWGDSFDPSNVPAPAFDGSQVSGFGLQIINKTVDAVKYCSDDRAGNCIELVKLRRAA